MHDQFAALGLTAPARRGAPAHATAGFARSHAAATIHGGTCVCESKISYLRTSALPVAWSPRGTNGNQPGGSRLQSEKNAKHPRRTPTGFSAANHLTHWNSGTIPKKSKSDAPQPEASLFL